MEEQVRSLIDSAEQTFGALAVLVNNASGPDIRPDEPLEHASP
jgi:NAD(P)-dependent dehydrogenase (short-subunit alcohol dehydrogenase family)